MPTGVELVKQKGSTPTGDDDSDGHDSVSDSSDEDNSDKQAWPSHSHKIRFKLDMPDDLIIWTDDHPMTGVPKRPRQYDCVQVAYWAWLRSQVGQPRQSTPNWWVDCSQGVQRTPWGPTPGSFQKGSLHYSFYLNRVLDWEDSCMRQHHRTGLVYNWECTC